MKAYVAISGAIFGVIVIAHLLRIVDEGPQLAMDPAFVLLTAAAAALCVWAVRVFRRARS